LWLEWPLHLGSRLGFFMGRRDGAAGLGGVRVVLAWLGKWITGLNGHDSRVDWDNESKWLNGAAFVDMRWQLRVLD
jgi:hypothetical protein